MYKIRICVPVLRVVNRVVNSDKKSRIKSAGESFADFSQKVDSKTNPKFSPRLSLARLPLLSVDRIKYRIYTRETPKSRQTLDFFKACRI
jgi:hypothetical protein